MQNYCLRSWKVEAQEIAQEAEGIQETWVQSLALHDPLCTTEGYWNTLGYDTNQLTKQKGPGRVIDFGQKQSVINELWAAS